MNIKPNCLKAVFYDNEHNHYLSETIHNSRYAKVYEIGKPTYPENGTFLFCYSIDEEVIKSWETHHWVSKLFYAYAEDLQPAKVNNFFQFCPSDVEIEKFWGHDRPYKVHCMATNNKQWRFASSITLLEEVK